jgi:transposase
MIISWVRRRIGFMAGEFKAVDRDQGMLLPPDLRDWLPADHLAWLVLEVVGQCDLSAISQTYRRGGVGREAFDPALLTGLLIYGYCQGVRSSRQIERACLSDVAFRVVAAQQRPDHTTIARFRAAHAAALADLFGQVLGICHDAGLGRVGVVAIDGTKIAGQASPRKNYPGTTLRKIAADIVADAAAVDAAEDAEYGPDRGGDELPETLAPGADRAARIRAALTKVQTAEQAAVEADVAAAEQALQRSQRAAQRIRRKLTAQRQGRTSNRARRPVDDNAHVSRADARVEAAQAGVAKARAGQGRRAQTAKPTVNISDPESHLMVVNGKGYLQGYNAQLAVTDDHLIVATEVTATTTDTAWFVPMMQSAAGNAAEHLAGAQIGIIVADAGYCSHTNLTAAGPDRLIATGRKPDQGRHTATNPAITAMAARLADGSAGRAIYQRRQATVEPVIGHLKDRIGLRRFTRRGLQAAKHELALAATAHNIRRLATG